MVQDGVGQPQKPGAVSPDQSADDSLAGENPRRAVAIKRHLGQIDRIHIFFPERGGAVGLVVQDQDLVFRHRQPVDPAGDLGVWSELRKGKAWNATSAWTFKGTEGRGEIGMMDHRQNFIGQGFVKTILPRERDGRGAAFFGRQFRQARQQQMRHLAATETFGPFQRRKHRAFRGAGRVGRANQARAGMLTWCRKASSSRMASRNLPPLFPGRAADAPHARSCGVWFHRA